MRQIVVTAGLLPLWLTGPLAARYETHDLSALTVDVAQAATVIVKGGPYKVDAAMMNGFPALRLIASFSVGVDSVDLAFARARGIAISNTPDVLTDDVADMAIALVFATARRITVNDRLVRSGGWVATAQPITFGRRVTGLRFGILGLGRIGAAIARRLEPIAGTIAYHNRKPVPDSGYAFAESAEALARDCDVLIVATSGGSESRHLVDAAVIDALGPTGMLVNIGRGSTVDEEALVAALVEGRLGSAGLDVFADEPGVPGALLGLDQVVLQPHQASATPETRTAMADLVLANVAAFFAGEPLPTPV